MRLNCDLGEDFGPWSMSVDESIYATIDQANIACGFHAGDPVSIEKALRKAIASNVQIGAHPGYPDLVGFGRRHIAMGSDELSSCLRYQIAALDGLTSCWGSQLQYVKPHGALYNDCVSDNRIRQAVFMAMRAFPHLQLMLQAHPEFAQWQREAESQGLSLLSEAFIDRRYQANGALTPRNQEGAVLDKESAIEQGRLLIQQGIVIDNTGNPLSVSAQSLCVHGDNADAVMIAQTLKQIIESSA